MKHLAISLAVLMLVWAGDAKARTGNELLVACQDEGICLGWVNGWLEAYLGLATTKKTREEGNMCVPNPYYPVQIRDIFIKYLEEHPEYRHLPVSQLMVSSLVKAFPCTK